MPDRFHLSPDNAVDRLMARERQQLERFVNDPAAVRRLLHDLRAAPDHDPDPPLVITGQGTSRTEIYPEDLL